MNSIRVLALDFETQCSNAQTTNITELGAILYEVTHIQGTNHVAKLVELSSFVYDESYPPQSELVKDITGISDEMLKESGQHPKLALGQLLPLVQGADVVMAHKTAFDWTVFSQNLDKNGMGEPPKKELLCTLTNFPWPKKFTCHKLGHLAWEHDILVKASDLHRAVNDVELMAQLVFTKYDFFEVLKYARSPWVYFKADVMKPWVDGGASTGHAKTFGFSWEQVKGTEGPKFPKAWVTRVKEHLSEEWKEQIRNSSSPFRVTKIEGIN